jgi:uncharacterized protein YeaO (DUF488 family)
LTSGPPILNEARRPVTRIKRIYEAPSRNDGYGALVDRLWPRGIKKEKAGIDLWLKDAAPSDELRRWFKHESQKWGDFKTRYFAELEHKQGILKEQEDKEIDLIVIATHGRTGLMGHLLGSVAEKVVRHAKCPVFLVRGK